MYDEIPLINNQANNSFEMVVDGYRCFIDYKQKGETWFLVHTEVPEQLQGRGIATALVEKTFKYIEANHSKMRIYCEYIKAYLQRHPEWERLVAK